MGHNRVGLITDNQERSQEMNHRQISKSLLSERSQTKQEDIQNASKCKLVNSDRKAAARRGQEERISKE